MPAAPPGCRRSAVPRALGRGNRGDLPCVSDNAGKVRLVPRAPRKTAAAPPPRRAQPPQADRPRPATRPLPKRASRRPAGPAGIVSAVPGPPAPSAARPGRGAQFTRDPRPRRVPRPDNPRGAARNCSKATFCSTSWRMGLAARNLSCQRRSTALPDIPSACSKTFSGWSTLAGSSAEAKEAQPTRTRTTRSRCAGRVASRGTEIGEDPVEVIGTGLSAPDGPLQISSLGS
jgi:hypothetical protein